MIDERGLVALLFRADWRKLSLSGEVRGGSVPLISVVTEQLRPDAPFPPFPPPPGAFAEDEQTLLVAPGNRYRIASQDGQRVRGCDGERVWEWLSERAPDTEYRLGGDLGPPFPELLAPSWLLTGYDLAVEGDATACGRAAIRVVATGRARDHHMLVPPPLRWPVIWADRVVALVDAELGILLRCESQRGERAPDVVEFLSLTVPAETDPGQFTAPPESVFGEGSWPWSFPFPFGGPGREVAKTAAGLAAAGLGAVIKCTPRRRPDPFARATEEAADPDAMLPRDDGPGPDGPPDPDASPVRKKVLHLLYRSGTGEPRFTATLHEWFDGEALLEAVPDSARKTGFGGVGFLIDALRDAAQNPGTRHEVSSVRIGGWDRYRIDVTGPAQATDPRPGHCHGQDRSRQPQTDACDGRRRWQVYGDRVVETPEASLPAEVRVLADGSWLLGAALSGGAEITVGGRRAYRVAGRALHRNPWPMLGVFDPHSLPAVAAVDAETGRLLRLTRYAGGKPVMCSELRDIEPDGAGDFGFEPPAGLRVVREPDEQPWRPPAHPAGFVTKAAADAARGFLGSLRGPWR